MSKFIMGLIFGLSLFFVVEIGGELEGRILPVMERLEISDPQEFGTSRTRTVWKGQARKRRDCQFVAMEWYLGPVRGRKVQVHTEFLDPPQVRTPGLLEWDGIVIDLPEDTVLRNSHAIVFHRCAFRPWLTRTLFYSSER